MAQTAAMPTRGLRHDAGALVTVLPVAAAVVGELAGGTASTLVSLGLFAAGVLHGAAEEDEGGIYRYSAAHAAGYVAFAAGIAALYLAAPVAGLAAFLILSAWHFADGRCDFCPASRYAIAGVAIGGSALFMPTQTAAVFATITGQPVPDFLVQILAFAGMAGMACAAYAIVRRQSGAGYAIIAVLAAMLAGPVMAVALIFFVAHAAPVQRRQIARHGLKEVLSASLATGILALLGTLALVALAWSGMIAIPVAVAIAFGMATPHMLTDGL